VLKRRGGAFYIIMTLFFMPVGERCVVTRVDAEEKVKRRLEMLNVFAGAEVYILGKSPLKKNILLLSGGLRVGIGRETALKISVKKVD